jgi:hypothetical protein
MREERSRLPTHGHRGSLVDKSTLTGPSMCMLRPCWRKMIKHRSPHPEQKSCTPTWFQEKNIHHHPSMGGSRYNQFTKNKKVRWDPNIGSHDQLLQWHDIFLVLRYYRAPVWTRCSKNFAQITEPDIGFRQTEIDRAHNYSGVLSFICQLLVKPGLHVP